MLKFIERRLMSNAQKHYLYSKEFGKEHPKTIEVSKLLDKEYAPSSLQETTFMLSLPFSLWGLMKMSSKNALQLAENICKELGAPNIQGFEENRKREWSEASYNSQTQKIHADMPIRIDILLHELTHHIQSHIDFWEPFRKMHGKKFCEVELRVFDIVLKGARNE